VTDKLIAKESTYVWCRLPHYEKQVGKTYEQVMVEMMEKTEALESRVQRLEKALEMIAANEIITTNGTNMGCPTCDSPEIAKKALEAKG
jgi:hypothetical protein